ncbi:MAG: OsmC family protein [Deltaproteobacteria bacterium]|nr:OsmC family protein [Deltaproteobacteria bacterium]MBI4796143.1 OsmC family protein [Deltaproteobacteria bacterium]
MIIAGSENPVYRTPFSDGEHHAVADTTKEKGGSGGGFWPHTLLEAALATCINITLRKYADKHAIPLSNAVTKVKLDRSRAEEVTFAYEVELQGNLTEPQHQALLRVAGDCPVKKTLLKRISFKYGVD